MRCALLLAPVAAALALPAAAQAQSPCGGSYRVDRGDTLYSIAQRCRTPLEAIMRANPFIDHPARIEVGWRLTIPGGAGASDGRGGPDEPPPLDYGSYRVRPGDTLYSIAARFGLRVADLIAANRGIDARDLDVGEVIHIPGHAAPDRGEDPAEARLVPSSAAPGEPVTVRAIGFRPYQPVMIAVGPPESEYETIARARSDARGRVEARVRVPDWAEPGRRLEWIVYDRSREEAHFDSFWVRAPSGGGDAGGYLEVTGVITREGVECPALRTDRGELYTLAGDAGEFRPGDRVVVSGRPAQMSFCMQGTTISVDDIRWARWNR